MGASDSTPGNMEESEEGAEAPAPTEEKAQTDVAKPQQEDVSEDVIDTEQDLGVEQYLITLHCELDNVRLTKDDNVNYALTGSSGRRLAVTVGNRIYHKMRLPGSVTKCKVEKKTGKKADTITITLDKTEHKRWKQGK